MSARYTEHAPAPGLADAVRCYWTIRGSQATADLAPVNRVLPDNCIDIIFDLRAERQFVVGPMLAAEVVPTFAAISLLGVRFCPGAATSFLDARASELASGHADADALWPNASSVGDELCAAAPQARVAVLDRWLLARRRRRREVDLARRATVAIERSRGRLTVARVAALANTSDRTLLRAFDVAVGVGPKEALRVERFRVAAAMIERPPSADRSLSRIAAACGYADQAHLTREFTALSGLSPAAYRAERRLVGFLQD